MRPILLIIVAIIFALSTFAQGVVHLSGDVSALKNQKSIAVEFRYDNLKVEGMSEASYIESKKNELNQKEPGRGDSWEAKWNEDRKTRFEPKFRELFFKYSKLAAAENAPYKLIVDVTRLDPNVSMKALLSGQAIIVDIQNNNSVVTKYQLIEIIGKASGSAWGPIWTKYDAGIRLQESFAKAGKELGINISKDLGNK